MRITPTHREILVAMYHRLMETGEAADASDSCQFNGFGVKDRCKGQVAVTELALGGLADGIEKGRDIVYVLTSEGVDKALSYVDNT